jgi:hypothetical protein
MASAATALWMLCADVAYEEWRREIEALPERKRKNWSGTLVRPTGERHKIVYRPSVLPSGAISLFAGRVHQKLAPLGFPVGELIPYVTFEMEEHEVQAARERGEELLDVNGSPLAAITEDLAREVHQRLADEQGPPRDRPRRRYVRVPTAPGQPVRG